MFLGEDLGLFSRHLAEMAQIALVAHQHDDDVGSSVLAELSQPALYVLKCHSIGNVVNQQCSHGSTVIGACDGTVSLLSCGLFF